MIIFLSFKGKMKSYKVKPLRDKTDIDWLRFLYKDRPIRVSRNRLVYAKPSVKRS